MPKKQNNRRKFLRDLSLGTASLLSIQSVETGDRFSQHLHDTFHPKAEPVLLGKDVKIELLSKDGFFLGIGSVQIEGTSLRDGTLPLFCDIRTPDGIQVTELPILTKTVSPEKIEIKMGARSIKTPVMEYMLHSVRNRENLYGWAEKIKEEPETFVTLKIFPVTRIAGGLTFRGFSYQYHFESKHLPIYKILDHGTWEINGHAIGNECWMRVGHVPSIVSFDEVGQQYSTENYYAGIANPNVFQFLPLQTELQGFTFQAHQKGILVTWATQVEHIRTLLEKPAGQDRIFHFHQHCNDLSTSLVTSPVEVLWLSQTGSGRVDRYNIFEDVRVMVHAHLHQQTGIRPERVSTYGMIEEWDEPDFDNYTDKILPEFKKKGIRRLFLPNEFQNAMNTWGLSNMCCNVDFKFSDSYDLEKLRRFCDEAHRNGFLVDMWGNTALSSLTEMFQWHDGKEKGIRFLPKQGSIEEVLKKSKDPWVRNPSNAIEGDHYTPRFAVMNLRDPDIREYWMTQWKYAYDTGIHGIFLDSSFNMSSDKFHFVQNTQRHENPDGSTADSFYRPEKQPPSAILTQYHAHLQWVKQMQDIGFSYCGEDLGVFGVHRHGPDLDMFINCMPLFTESFMDFDEKLAVKAGHDPLMIFFKGLAYRIMWMLRWDFSADRVNPGIRDERAYGFLDIFNEINEFMITRTILPDETAVLYHSLQGTESKNVYWVFKSSNIRLAEKKRVRNLMTHNDTFTEVIQAAPLTVYLVT
ncbi:MAG TPA: hypothetical protein VII28_10460 [Puia sp.]